MLFGNPRNSSIGKKPPKRSVVPPTVRSASKQICGNSNCCDNHSIQSPFSSLVAHGLFHLLVHDDSPAATKCLHSPDCQAAPGDAYDTEAREQPPVSDGCHQWLSNNCCYARKHVAHEVVERNAMRGLPRHELGKHCGDLDYKKSA